MNNQQLERIAALSPEKRQILLQRLHQQQKKAIPTTIQPQSRTTDYFPLSFAQARLWFLDQLEPGNAFYHIPAALRLQGRLNVAVLKQTLQEIIKRHEILRTNFQIFEGQPVQKIAPASTIDETVLSIVDLQALEASEQQKEIARLALEESQLPFDLTRDRLIRFRLLQLGETEHIAFCTMHHIISDGWSLGILVNEIAALYEDFLKGKPSPLPALPIQYADFAVWQKQWLTEDVLETQLAYWKQHLDGIPPLLELPTDKTRPPLQTFHGATRSQLFPKALTEAIKSLSRQQDVTMFMTLLAAFKTLLYRYTGQTNIVVGSPIANRNRMEIEGLIGFFVNSLVLRSQLSDELTFCQLLDKVRDVTLAAYAHQDLPFEKLVEELQLERNLSYNPVFQVMFQLQNLPNSNLELPELTLSNVEIATQTTQFDLSLNIAEVAEGLEAAIEYSTDLFDDATIARMLAHYQTLLESIVANPQTPICNLPLLTPSEEHQLLEWGRVERETRGRRGRSASDSVTGGASRGEGETRGQEDCVHQLFEAQVEKTPDAIALTYENQHLTYRELNTQAQQLADYLQSIGVQPEIKVGIYLERSPLTIVALLGILKAGGAYLPLDPSHPQERLAFMLQDSQVSFILTQKSLIDSLPEHQTEVICLDSDRDLITTNFPASPTLLLSPSPSPPPHTPSNLAYTIYTSGSTGKPKGVEITHRALVSFLTSMSQTLEIQAADIWFSVTTITFDIAALEIFLPLIVGARLILASREVTADGFALAKQLRDSGATIMQATPATWKMLLAASWQGSPQLKILCGGEALSTTLAHQLLQRGAMLWNLYGPTETTIWSTAYQVQPGDEVISIGKPLANTQVYICDRNLQPVPIGVPGELYIGGTGVARGYFNRQELTEERFIFKKARGTRHEALGNEKAQGTRHKALGQEKVEERLYKTGDLTRWLPDGNLEFLGRIDDQVKIRGFRIELGEIETVLRQHPDIQEAVVIAKEDKLNEKKLIAYLVPHLKEKSLPPSVSNHDKDDLLLPSALCPLPSETPLPSLFLKQKLPDYMLPSAFVVLEKLPLTPNGKIDRRKCAAIAKEQSNPKIDFEVAYTPIEQELRQIWSEFLNGIDRDRSFFEMGGHSLLATQVMSRVRDTFGLEIPLRFLFEFPTIAELAQQIEAMMREKEKLQVPPLKPIARDRELPLSFAQARLWFLSQIEPENPIYNVSSHFKLTGSLNTLALEKGINEVIRRHEILRTSFTIQDEQPIQVIAPSLTIPVPIIDLQALSPSQQEAEIKQAIAREELKPFDLANCPLLRVTLLRLEPEAHVLLLTMHHIITDGWSLGVLFKELAILYEAFSTGKPSPLPELPIQYADFALWQRQWLQGEVLEKQLNYWKKQLLGGNLPRLSFPTSPLKFPTSPPKLGGSGGQNFSQFVMSEGQNSPKFKESRGQNLSQDASHSFELSTNLSQQLHQLSRQENVTLFMTLLAALQVLLSRYGDRDDVVIGTDIANRTQSETELLIGFFVNLLVLRTDLGGNSSFRELLQRVRQVTLEAYAHQDLPFEKLVEALRPDRSLNQTPLFQVLLVLQNTPMPSIEVSNLTLYPLESEAEMSKFDLVLFVAEDEQQLSLTWKYKTNLFDEKAIAQMTSNFTSILNNIVKQPETPIKNLETLPQKTNFNKFKTIKPKAVSLEQEQLVKTSYLQPGETLPLVIQPNVDDLDPFEWTKNNREFLETNLLKHGAILFRNFAIEAVTEFENFAHSIYPQLFGNYGDLPREEVSNKVYGSTPYPSDKAILFHNESSHLQQFPLKIWFFCLKAAQTGGETPIVDCRKIYQMLNPKLVERFTQKQLMYVRNFTEGLDVSWSQFFHTTDKAALETYCRQQGIEWEWRDNNGLRTKQIRPAVAKHPKTGEMVFFNQLQLHHFSYLDTDVRASLLSIFGEENLPRHVYYGDGTPIEDSVIEEISGVYRAATIAFPWQEGNVLMLDNMLTAHGRNPYIGSRKIVVAMGEIV